MSAIPYRLEERTKEHETPAEFFNEVNARYGPLELDVCATRENAKCPRFFTPEDDGLRQRWAGKCWMHPPDGKDLRHWIRKAYVAARNGAVVVCLIPSRTGTQWFQDYVRHGQVTFLPGRMRFVGEDNDSPYPLALVVFDFRK